MSKIRFIFAALALSAFVTTAQAQTNLRLNPLGSLVGSYNLNLDFKVGDQWSIGPELTYYTLNYDRTAYQNKEIETTGGAAGLRFTWYKNGAFADGLYFSPSAAYGKTTAKYRDVNGVTSQANAQGPTVGVLLGYGWFWSHFNIMLGVGARSRVGSDETTITDSNGVKRQTSDTAFLYNGEFSLGWVF